MMDNTIIFNFPFIKVYRLPVYPYGSTYYEVPKKNP